MAAKKGGINFAQIVAVLIGLAILEVAVDIFAFPLDEILVPGEAGFDLLVVIIMAAMQYFGGGNMRLIK